MEKRLPDLPATPCLSLAGTASGDAGTAPASRSLLAVTGNSVASIWATWWSPLSEVLSENALATPIALVSLHLILIRSPDRYVLFGAHAPGALPRLLDLRKSPKRQ